MRIRSQLMTLAALAGFVAMLWIGLSARALGTMATDLEAHAQAQAAASNAASMLALTNELSVDGDNWASTLWLTHHAQLSAQVDQALQRHHEPPQLIELHAKVARLGSLFAQFQDIGPSPADAPTQRSRSQLLEPVLAETHAILEIQQRWITTLTEAQYLHQRHTTLMGLSASATLLVLLLALCLLVRRVLGPLAHLKSALTASQSGHLDEAPAEPVDEVDDAVRTVNATGLALHRLSLALQTSEHRLRMITDNLPALICYFDRNEVCRFTNAHYERILDKAPGELLGKSVDGTLGATFCAELRPHLEGVLKGECREFERRGIGSAPESTFLVNYVPDFDDTGNVIGFCVMAMDITTRKQAELRQAASERLLADITDNIPALVAYVDRDERCRFANARHLDWLGVDHRAMIGRHVSDSTNPAFFASVQTQVRAALAGERVRWEHNDKEVYYLSEFIPNLGADGVVNGFYALTIDISALKHASQEQALLERQLHDITDNLPVLIAYVDNNECYQFTNATFSQWLGTQHRRMFGRKVSEVMTPHNYEQRRQHLKAALAGQRVEFNLESTFLGVTRMLQNVYIPDIRPDGAVAGLYALSTDVTELKRVERMLYQLAHADSLTGLPNRRQFDVCLAECIDRASVSAKSVSVMFMDIDKFKCINDQFGHATGDAVLREFAARLGAHMRTTDTAARLAGDEFVVLLEGLDAQIDAEQLAQKIVASIRAPFLIDGVAHLVTTSLGAVFCARPGHDSPLLEYADAALYEAKEAGRNTYRVKTLESVVH